MNKFLFRICEIQSSERFKSHLINDLKEKWWRALKFFITFEENIWDGGVYIELKSPRAVGWTCWGQNEYWQEIRWRRSEHRPFASRPTMPIRDTTLSPRKPFPVNPVYLINRYHKWEMGFHERFCYLNYSYISHGCWKTCAEIQFWLQIRLLLRINLSLLHVFLQA